MDTICLFENATNKRSQINTCVARCHKNDARNGELLSYDVVNEENDMI